MKSISVILCTYNRCQSLAKALESAAALVCPASLDWEVLVVDNNSSDQTREVVEDISRRYPGRFRYVFEIQQGLCHARNAAVREARGEILAFMDDDVVVPPDWLINLTASLHEGDYAGAGGRILPDWPSEPPKWLPREGPWALAPLVVFDRGLEPGALNDPPYGANMAFKKDMFEKYGSFRADLDRVGTSLISGGDTEFGGRLLAAGERLRYEPSALLYHPVTPDRMQKRYFLKWRFDGGRGEVRQFGIKPNTKFYLGAIPLYLFRRLAVWTVRWLLTIGASPRFECKLNVWGVSGQIVECYQRSLVVQHQERLRDAGV